MPSWDVHSRIYELLGLDSRLCSIIDEIVDSEPPRYKEINPEWPNQRARIHFGSNKNEFPFMYNYIVKNYGVRGGECLIAHFVLDKIENNLKDGLDREIIGNEIEGLLESYQKGCSIVKYKCIHIEEALDSIKDKISKNLDQIIKIIGEWVESRTTPIDVLVKASSETLNLIAKTKLYLKGYRGKHGFTVQKRLLRSVCSAAEQILRKKIYEAMMKGELNPGNALVSINKIKKLEMEKHTRTIKEYFTLVNQEAERNKDFKALLEKIHEAIDEAMRVHNL